MTQVCNKKNEFDPVTKSFKGTELKYYKHELKHEIQNCKLKKAYFYQIEAMELLDYYPHIKVSGQLRHQQFRFQANINFSEEQVLKVNHCILQSMLSLGNISNFFCLTQLSNEGVS